MDNKHTPGPWGLEHHLLQDGNGGEKYSLVTIRPNKTIKIHTWKDEDEANARLIASAPDLLEALEGLMKNEPQDAEYPGWLQKARSIISKAKRE